jgi:mono/diheme cytochrome c family protein
MFRRIASVFAILAVVIMGPVGLGAQAKPAPGAKPVANPKALKNPVAADAASVDAGRALYAKYCRACHGAEGKGDGPAAAAMKDVKPADLSDATWTNGSTDGEIYATIHDGIGPKFAMNAFTGRLDDTQIWNVVNFVKMLGPKK